MLAALGLLLGLAGLLGAGAARARPLQFLGNAQIAPIVFELGGEAQGVAVELTRAMLARSGLDAQVRAGDWAQAQAQVASGEADALIQINITPERAARFDFSEVLLESRFHLFVRSGPNPVHDLASLAGRRVGVEGAGFPYQFLQPHAGIVLVTVPSWHRGFEMLSRGELDAVFVDRWVGEYALSLNRLEGISVVEPALVTSQSHIAVRKGQAELLARINLGLAAIATDGTRQAILERWQGKQVVYVTRQQYERSSWALAALVLALLLGGMGALVLRHRGVQRHNASLVQVQQQLRQALAVHTQALEDARQARAAMETVLAEQRAVLASDFIGLIRMDLQAQRIAWANNAACRMLGYAEGALVGLPVRTLFVNQEEFEGFGARCAAALQAGETVHEEIRQRRNDGGTGWYLFSASALQPPLIVAAIVDVTERRLAEDEAAYLAYFDALTGLANRRMLGSRIELALAQSKRSQRHGALVFLDLDNFKPLNDRHGHELGDLMLREVAARILKCVREVDTVARFGGDEFVVLLTELEGERSRAEQSAAEVAEKIRRALAAPYRLQPPGGRGPAVTHSASASLGVVLFANGQPGAGELLVQGDAAMYAAKAAGRNLVRFGP